MGRTWKASKTGWWSRGTGSSWSRGVWRFEKWDQIFLRWLKFLLQGQTAFLLFGKAPGGKSRRSLCRRSLPRLPTNTPVSSSAPCAVSHSLTLISGITSETNRLNPNPCLRVCFWQGHQIPDCILMWSPPPPIDRGILLVREESSHWFAVGIYCLQKRQASLHAF